MNLDLGWSNRVLDWNGGRVEKFDVAKQARKLATAGGGATALGQVPSSTQLFVTAQGLFSARRLSLGVSLWGPGLGAGGHRL